MRVLIGVVFVFGMFGCAEGNQTDACRAYVDCIDARDAAAGIQTNVVRFESDGDCWGSEPGAKLCDTACTRGLDYLGSLDGAPMECVP